MDRAQGRKIVLGTFFLILAMISIEELYVQKRTPNPQRYVGALIAWFLLGVVVEVEPSVGAGLALLATGAMALTKGKVLESLPGVSSNGQYPNTQKAIAKGHP